MALIEYLYTINIYNEKIFISTIQISLKFKETNSSNLSSTNDISNCTIAMDNVVEMLQTQKLLT